MPIIRPVSELRNNFSKISETVHKKKEPIFLTKNGIGDMVVMSIDFYEQQLAKLELYQLLNTAQNEIKNKAQGKEANQLIDEMML